MGAALLALSLLFLMLRAPAAFAQGADEVSNDRYLQLIQYVFSYVQNNYVDEVDPRVLYEGAMNGILNALEDPYTSYIDAESLMHTSLRDTTTGSFGGVGLSITKPLESTPEKPAWVEVSAPIEDSPGWKAGVQPGDLILQIDGQGTADLTMEEVLARLRGPVGTSVTVTLRRGKAMEFPVTLVRALIEVPTVKFAMMDGGIGYNQDHRVYAPDRGPRPGGDRLLLEAGIYLADHRPSEQPGRPHHERRRGREQVHQRGHDRVDALPHLYENKTFSARPSRASFPSGVPIVVLVNKYSASASEILAGALKDHRRAYLVGETTYGKGSVQQVIDLTNGDGMKVTMARYYTPSDANIDKLGIPPDREVLFPSFSEEEEKALGELLKTTKLADFVAGTKDLTSPEAERFARELAKTYRVDVRVLKRLVMQEYYRTHISPLYDLEYDVQLKAAVDVIKKEDMGALLRGTKTVKELQDAAQTADGKKVGEAASAAPASIAPEDLAP
jgi:carboxyl-terminal processing protease